MTLRKVFIQNPEFIPDVSEITGMSVIQLEYEFKKSEILGQDVCVVEVELSPEQAQEIDRRAKERRDNGSD